MISQILANSIEQQYTPEFLLEFAAKYYFEDGISNDMQRVLDEFIKDPDVWAKKVRNFATSQVLYRTFFPSYQSAKLIIDPIRMVRNTIYDPVTPQFLPIASGNTQGAMTEFYFNDDNKLIMLNRFFEKDFLDIQSSLYYDGVNIKHQKLSYLPILSEIESKVEHTYSKLFKILSELSEGTKIEVVFHQEKANGFGTNTRFGKVMKSLRNFFKVFSVS